MKPKYILENYDRILKEIKNPKIIFSNDLMPILENFASESFLIYQVDFIKQDNTTKYIVKKPIHNLHPKVTKLNFKGGDVAEEFEPFIPKILDELNIPEKQISLRWCSKNENVLYLLQECEIEDLSQENRFFLYCYHSLKNENQKIKKINKERVFKLKSKKQIEQYIHRKQYILENLAHRLVKEINPINSSDLYQFSNNYDKIDCLKIAYIYLEKLLRFIEKEYRNYLNVNIQIPNRSTLVKEFGITNKLKEVKSRLLGSNINDQLLKLAYEPLLKIATINIQEKLTYYEFNYCSEFITTLYKQINFADMSEETIKEFLFDLNFNSLQFFKYLTFEILQELETQENNIKKIDVLYRFLKNYNQKQSRSILKYKANLPSLKEQIISWIEEEIEYLTKKIKLEANQFTNVTNNDEKIKLLTGLSVAQLSCFFGLLMETGIIKHKNQTDVFRFISENFKTNNTEKISVDSIKVKYYNVENTTKKALREKIIELLGLTKF
ncbi:hypothetical protein [Flavobacterium psychrotolerans]|uniref:Uncharacterized protein n=1 Tax=Flavobacterium psychrotolerans TaxID=2169410 RepID=A0A2U1JJ19_9FLAO|nr:hypothetical protein [Flavobacterium psychrotolerans]PWA05005.1 hypothetical protein DB895_08180 [Flavobacterium psychrotolerans]